MFKSFIIDHVFQCVLILDCFFSESMDFVKCLLFFPHCLVEDAANTEEIHEKTWKVMRHDQT